MPIALSCSCGRALRVKDELAGKKIRCPECKSILAVATKKTEALDVLEVLDTEDEEEAPRRAAIQTQAPEARPARRRAVEDDEPIPRKRPKPTRDIKRRTPAVTFERGWFGSINAGVAGGILMILIAVVWFIGGLAVGYFFFYPPILLVIGIIAIIKGGLGNN